MHTVSQSVDVLSLELFSQQNWDLELNQENHMVTHAAHTVKMCVLKTPAEFCTEKAFLISFGRGG